MKRFKNTAYSARLGEKIANEMIKKPGDMSYTGWKNELPAYQANRLDSGSLVPPFQAEEEEELEKLWNKHSNNMKSSWNTNMKKYFKGKEELEAFPKIQYSKYDGEVNGYLPAWTSKKYMKKAKKTGYLEDVENSAKEYFKAKNEIIDKYWDKTVKRYGGVPGKSRSFWDGEKYQDLPDGYSIIDQIHDGGSIGKPIDNYSYEQIDYGWNNGKITSNKKVVKYDPKDFWSSIYFNSDGTLNKSKFK